MELFECCSASKTSDTFWQIFQSLKDISPYSTSHLHQFGILSDYFFVSTTIMLATLAIIVIKPWKFIVTKLT